MQIKSLRPNSRNPRRISDKRLENLKKSLKKFGDLGGIVFNRRTKTIVSGHQRAKALPPNATIKITDEFKNATGSGTVALGTIIIDGEKFNYREVDVPVEVEIEMLLAANNQGGENDQELLKVVLADFPTLDLDLVGLEPLKPLAPLSPSPASSTEETDEKYVANTPQTTEQIPTVSDELNKGSSIGDVKEKAMDVVGRRFVIIIDCQSQDHKEALKEKLQTLVTESGAKFF